MMEAMQTSESSAGNADMESKTVQDPSMNMDDMDMSDIPMSE